MTRDERSRDLNWLRGISSFTTSRIILTANNFRIFDHLDGKGKSASIVSKAIAANARAAELLLNSLTAIGLLEKNGSLYRNSGVASKYLVHGKPDYQGDILMHNDVLWENWSGLDVVLKTGRPYRKAHDHTSFILGMHNIASQRADDIVASIKLAGVKKILDLGGGPGTYSMAFAKKGVAVTLFDYPDTFRISRKLIKGAGLEKKVKLMPGDILKSCWGEGYDMVFISQIFHAYSAEECISMLKKSHDCLNPRGRVVVQEFYIEESRTAPLQGAIFAINMLVNTPKGRTYTVREMSSWMKKTGFEDIVHKNLNETVLVTGTKKKSKTS